MPAAPPGSTTSLRRAARHEHARITAERDRIRERVAQIESELESLERVDGELADQVRLLEQVISTELGAMPSSEQVVLRGARLREEALRVLVSRVGIREPIFYRDWYRLVRDAGFVVLAKRPEAAFLTTVTRSPLVARAGNSGTYYIEPSVVDDLRQELLERQAELRDLESHLATRQPGASPLQRHRLNLMATIRRLERQVAEADRILTARHDAVFAPARRAA
jgi:septal ring factor EnvC (AmiA/AmiB activator)